MKRNALAMAVLCSVFMASASAQEAPFGVGSWPETGYGNHRALVHVSQGADAVRVHIPWRRRDLRPEDKAVLLYDLATGKRVTNVIAIEVTRAFGDFVFQPETVPGDYGFYYLPYNPGTGHFDDAGTYFAPEQTAAPDWGERNGLAPGELAKGAWQSLPGAEVVEIQARNSFNRMDPMEVIATEAEVAALLERYPDAPCLVFPEDREHAIRMFDDLPYRWIECGPRDSFAGMAHPGEYYVFQLGVWAARTSIEDIQLAFTDLESQGGAPIPRDAFTCFNLEGTDWLGRPINNVFRVGQGKVRPLWIGLQIPPDAQGTYTGAITLTPKGLAPRTVSVNLEIAGQALEDAGDSELWRLSRLRWLNSTMGLEDEVMAPFTPVEVEDRTVSCLGRRVTFSDMCLPESIVSSGREILSRPVTFEVSTTDGAIAWSSHDGGNLQATDSAAQLGAAWEHGPLAMNAQAEMEFDGCITFRLDLKASEAVDLSDVQLLVPIRKEVAAYMMGMTLRGGYRPPEWRWKWDINRADNMVWLGCVDAGLQVKLCHDVDTWQLSHLRDCGLPESWDNGGQGGCDITEQGDEVLLRAYTGSRSLEAGQKVSFRFRFLVTPFKPVDPMHWNWRYGDVKRDGNISHIHHATPPNPYINYPFLTADKLARLVDEVKGFRHVESDPGQLHYPAAGNIDLEQGALHIWTTLLFDPQAGEARHAEYNQALFSLAFPNQDEIGFYWNVDDRGMRAYIRKGAPSNNEYPALISSTSPGWRQGEHHVLTLSWGEEFAILVDGERLVANPFKGTLDNALDQAQLVLRGKGFAIDAIRVDGAPATGNTDFTATASGSTLLLDTFAAWDGGAVTRPERVANGQGVFDGPCQKVAGQYGNAVRFISEMLDAGPKSVNLYYTVRELSNYAAEMWALRSLGDEIFKTGDHMVYFDDKAVTATEGGGYPWLQEHLVTGYVPAWRNPLFNGETDAAISTQGLSRWHNYYVEGMDWLMKRTGFDGLYLDGIGYDREIMKRVARVMNRNSPTYRINFHSGNNYAYQDRKVSPANQYMEHFPYISNLWFGEMYDYDLPPDYWLVEISGLPFGLASEMLNYQNGGNAYRGMVYGMTGRQHPSVSAMWRFWDDFGIQETEMLGYWSPECPVHTGREDVLATVYRKPGESLVALARWPGEEDDRAVDVRLEVDWDALGLDPAKVRLTAPPIDNFQGAASFAPSAPISVEPGKGWLLIANEAAE